MNHQSVPFFRPQVNRSDIDRIAEVLSSGHLTTGRFCTEFETRFKEFLGVKHAITVNSCSAALHLALVAAGIGQGDLVFVPSLGFAADAQAVLWQGATPIFIDCDPETLCLCPEKLQQTIEKIHDLQHSNHSSSMPDRLRAVIAIDYAGQMADYEKLQAICRDWGLTLIEDAAHALPASYRANSAAQWQAVGSVADYACFSFYATKPITTAEGGMIVTNNDENAIRLRAMRLHGLQTLSDHPWTVNWKRQVVDAGFKYNLPDLAAALGISQLERAEQNSKARRKIAKEYHERLSACHRVTLPKESVDRKHSWHLFVCRLNIEENNLSRESVMRRLYEAGIETSVHWYPLHLHKYFKKYSFIFDDLRNVDEIAPTLLSLPLFPDMSSEHVSYVCNQLQKLLEN